MINEKNRPISEVRIASQQPTKQFDKPKSTRRSILKVRTGCVTCKTRHIKCDETRPHCNNCIRSRRNCAGYVVTNSKRPLGPVQICWDSKQGARRFGTKNQCQYEMRACDFQDSMDMLYFEEFVSLIRGPWISAVSHTTLWQGALPQLARNNNTLRLIAIAIGALSVSKNQANSSDHDRRLMSIGSQYGMDMHYQIAVRHYCRALKLLIESNSIQDVVSSSVLLLFFEVLRGERKNALNHLNHSLSLMLALLTDYPHDCLRTVAPNPMPFLSSLTSILSLLAPQARFILSGYAGQDRPLPNFNRGLESKGLTMESFIVLLDGLSRRSSPSGPPSEFHNLEEFEDVWQNVRSGNHAVHPMAVEIVKRSGVLGSKDGDAIDALYHDLLGNQDIRMFCERSQQDMQILNKASIPLFNKIFMADKHSPTYLKAIHLRLQFLQTYAFENPPQYFSAETLNLQTPLFREYLSLARMALSIARRAVLNSPCQTSLECGIAWHLLLVAFFCRDPATRFEAVKVLGDYPCQDGLWNVNSFHILGLKSQDVEIANASEGSSAEQWHRLWRREYVFEDGGNRIVFRYQARSDATGIWETVEEVTDIPEESGTTTWRRRPITGFGALTMGDLVTHQVGAV